MDGIARVQNGKVLWWLAALSVLWLGGEAVAGGPQGWLAVNEHMLWSEGYDRVWAAVSVRDSGGKWVTGLRLADFELTESLISPSQQVLQERVITFDKPDYQFDGPGFWERSVTGEKLDIVCAVDMTGSMREEMPGIVRELHRLVDRLESNHVDFRIGIIKYGSDVPSVDDSFNLPFHGVMETREFHEWLDQVQSTGGEWYLPCVGYDVVLFASQLDFRPGARRVIVVISDSVPQTVYGTHWYLDSSTAASLSAVKAVLENSNLELFYCQPDHLEHLEHYGRPDFNPRALSTGFDALERLGLARRIPWPFQQEDLAITGGELVVSEYYFAWVTRLEMPRDPRNHTVRVTIKAVDTEHPGQFLQESFTYVPQVTLAPLFIQVTDESNQALDDVSVGLYREMGDRRERLYLLGPRDGKIARQVPIGDYYLTVRDGGNYRYAYTNLRYTQRRHITVPPAGLTVSLQVETADKEIELAKAKGLLEDLKDWGYCEKPFAPFAADALSWLESVKSGGVNLEEMEAVKRFYMALSGYVNTTGYAEVEVERAVEDFIDGSKEIRKLLQDLTDTGNDLTDRLLDPSTLGLLATYTTLLQQEAISAYAVEQGLTQTLVDYVKGPLVREVVTRLIDILPARSDLKNRLRLLVETLLFGKWDDAGGVTRAMATLALDAAVDEVKTTLPETTRQALLDVLDSLNEVSPAARAILRAALVAFFDGGFHGWDAPFFAQMEVLAGDAIAQLGGRDRATEELDKALLRLRTDARVAPGPLRDFVLPMTHLVAKVCVGRCNGGKIDDDVVIEVLARLFCNWMALRPLYTEPLLAQMRESLHRARHFARDPGDRWARYAAMSADFGDFRSHIMDPLNDEAWAALKAQESIDDWKRLLSGVQLALTGLEAHTVVVCAFYPAFCDKVDDLHNLIRFLNGLRVMSNILEFGLKLENMAAFTERTQSINPVLLPAYLRITKWSLSGAGLEITWRAQEGKSYRLQYKDDLGELAWKDLSEEIVASGRTCSGSDRRAGEASRRFYRVKQLE